RAEGGAAGARAQAERPRVAQSSQLARPGGAQRAAGPPPPDLGPGDLAAGRSQEFGFRLCRNIPEALRCGGDRLAVDAVLSVVEGDYPRNYRGLILYPR